MQAQIAAAIDERLRAEGPNAVGAKLVEHANIQKAALPQSMYDSYYTILTEYLEEINYAGPGAPIDSPVSPSAPPSVAPAPEAAASSTPVRSRKERLAELKGLLDDELITRDEYDSRRKDILAEV
jgi:hypothetical protein